MIDYNPMQQQNNSSKRTVTFVMSIVFFSIGFLMLLCGEFIYIAGNAIPFVPEGIAHTATKLIGTSIIFLIPLFIILRSKSINMRANGLLVLSILFILAHKKLLSKAKKDFTSFKAKTDKLINVHEEFFTYLDTASKQIIFLRNYESGNLEKLKKCAQSEREYTDAQIDNINQVCELSLQFVELFQRIDGHYIIEGNDVLFYDQKDVEAFNKLTTELDTLTQDHKTWKNEFTEKRKSLYNYLNNITKN